LASNFNLGRSVLPWAERFFVDRSARNGIFVQILWAVLAQRVYFTAKPLQQWGGFAVLIRNQMVRGAEASVLALVFDTPLSATPSAESSPQPSPAPFCGTAKPSSGLDTTTYGG